MNDIEFIKKYTLSWRKHWNIVINNNIVWFFENHPKSKTSKSYYNVSILLSHQDAINIFETKFKWKYDNSYFSETNPGVYVKDFVPQKIKVYTFLRLR